MSSFLTYIGLRLAAVAVLEAVHDDELSVPAGTEALVERSVFAMLGATTPVTTNAGSQNPQARRGDAVVSSSSMFRPWVCSAGSARVV